MKKKIKLASLFTVFLLQTFLPTFFQELKAEFLSYENPIYMSVSGKVTDKDTGLPIAKAKVKILRIETFQIDGVETPQITGYDIAETDSAGAYNFLEIPQGNYIVSVYPPTNSDYVLTNIPSELAVQLANVTDLDFKLELGGRVSGTAYEPDGVTPLRNAPVFAVSPDGGQGSALTDAEGKFTIRGLLPANTYTVATQKVGYATARVDNVIVTSGGTTSGISLNISSSVTGISGMARDSLGNPITTGVMIGVISENGLGGVATTDENGNYTLSGFQAGTYHAVVAAPGYNPVDLGEIVIDEGVSQPLDVSLTSTGKPITAKLLGGAVAVGYELFAEAVVRGGQGLGGGTPGFAFLQGANPMTCFFCSGYDITGAYSYEAMDVRGFGLGTGGGGVFAYGSGDWRGPFEMISISLPSPIPFVGPYITFFRDGWVGFSIGVSFGTPPIPTAQWGTVDYDGSRIADSETKETCP